MGLQDDLGAVFDKFLDMLPFMNRYPVTAIVREIRRDGTHVYIDKARRVIDKGRNRQYYFFKNKREKTLPIEILCLSPPCSSKPIILGR